MAYMVKKTQNKIRNGLAERWSWIWASVACLEAFSGWRVGLNAHGRLYESRDKQLGWSRYKYASRWTVRDSNWADH